MLRQKLFQGQSLKYDELEELMAAAKEKDDDDVIIALKNVVTDPEEEQAADKAADKAADTAADTAEPTPEDMMVDLMETGEIDKEALDENDFFDIDHEEDPAVCDETDENVLEEKLPESVIFNAVETLRRMY